MDIHDSQLERKIIPVGDTIVRSLPDDEDAIDFILDKDGENVTLPRFDQWRVKEGDCEGPDKAWPAITRAEDVIVYWYGRDIVAVGYEDVKGELVVLTNPHYFIKHDRY